MNRLCCLIGGFFTYGVCYAQNLVPNGNFEQYIGCPTNLGQIDSALFWFTPTWGTTDYFNQCSGSSFAGVPANSIGYQLANSGVGYGGIILIEPDIFGTGAYREYLEVPLTNSLISNACYHFEMYVNNANNCFYSTDTFSIYFSNFLVNGIANYGILPFVPQLKISNGINVDTLNWVVVEGNYVATGGEQYLIIGNFNTDSNTTVFLKNGMAAHPSAYYYIDDVSLSLCTVINESNKTESVNVFPNPFLDKINITTKSNELVEVNFYDVTARKIFNQSFINSTSINTEQLAKGIYLYEVRNKNGVIKKGKVVKD